MFSIHASMEDVSDEDSVCYPVWTRHYGDNKVFDVVWSSAYFDEDYMRNDCWWFKKSSMAPPPEELTVHWTSSKEYFRRYTSKTGGVERN